MGRVQSLAAVAGIAWLGIVGAAGAQTNPVAQRHLKRQAQGSTGVVAKYTCGGQRQRVALANF